MGDEVGGTWAVRETEETKKIPRLDNGVIPPKTEDRDKRSGLGQTSEFILDILSVRCI